MREHGANDTLEQKFLQDVSRSFALTIPQLPPPLERTVATAYLLCRMVDTIEDDTKLSVDQKGTFLRRFFELFDLNRSASAKLFSADVIPMLSEQTLPAEKALLAHTAGIMQTFFSFGSRQQKAIRHCVWKMASGMHGFQEQISPNGLKRLYDLDTYCYYVAGVVGEMLTELFCDYSSEIDVRRRQLLALAPSFGQGLQMTNILKDLWEDRARGVCWLPRELFKRSGFDLNRLSADNFDPAFGNGLASLIGITRWHLANALDYTLLIPADEIGIRKFCLWAIGMAVFTLRKINRKRGYTCGRDVKISHTTTRNIILVSNAAVKNNFLLKFLFAAATRGLPKTDVVSSDPDRGLILREESRFYNGRRISS